MRIKNHDLKKQWWTSAVFVTAGNKLNKTQFKYLEARLIQRGLELKLSRLDNAAKPALPKMTDADVSTMEEFLGNLLMIFPALGVDIFVQNVRPDPQSVLPNDLHPILVYFTLVSKKHGLHASAVLSGGEFIVEAGSQARLSWEGKESTTSGYAKLHQKLKIQGILKPEGNLCVFARNYAFNSPSAAAAVVLGHQAQGPLHWRTAPEGVTYKDWEAGLLSASVAG